MFLKTPHMTECTHLADSEQILNDPAVLPRFNAVWATLRDLLGEGNMPTLLEGLEIFGKANTLCRVVSLFTDIVCHLFLAGVDKQVLHHGR